jgi:hypothetical protein
MAADASVNGTTFEPRGPSLSIGTVGLFVNRIAGERRWCRGEREALKGGRRPPLAREAGADTRVPRQSRAKSWACMPREPVAAAQSRASARTGLPRRPALAGYPAR